MASPPLRPPSGHVFKSERARGPVWYAKYRLPDGRQLQRKIGPAWTDRGRPSAGYLTKRTAESWLRSLMDEARRGTLPGMVRTGTTFADAAAEWLRYIEHDRRRKPSTVTGYKAIVRSQLLPAFGELAIESLGALPQERRWPRDHDRSVRIARAAYLRSANERPLWIHTADGNRYDTLGAHRTELAHLLR
jgi:hypothetical protein